MNCKEFKTDELFSEITNGQLDKILNEIDSLICISKEDGEKINGNWKCKFTNNSDTHNYESNLSGKPGIYYIYDSDGNVYYIGETLNLYKRLTFHYHSGKILHSSDPIYKGKKDKEEIKKIFRQNFFVKVIIVKKENLNSLKHELRCIEQLSYIVIDDTKISKYLMQWDNQLYNDKEKRNSNYP